MEGTAGVFSHIYYPLSLYTIKRTNMIQFHSKSDPIWSIHKLKQERGENKSGEKPGFFWISIYTADESWECKKKSERFLSFLLFLLNFSLVEHDVTSHVKQNRPHEIPSQRVWSSKWIACKQQSCIRSIIQRDVKPATVLPFGTFKQRGKEFSRVEVFK